MNRTYLLLIMVIVLGLAFRLTSLRFYGELYEADCYYYLSLLTQAHGFTLPAISAYDGMPAAESYGLYFIPLFIHNATTLSDYNSMILSAPLFSVFAILLTFFFTKTVINHDKVALLAAFLVAVSPANMTRSMALAFRGDSFVVVPLLLALLLLVYVYNERRAVRGILFALASGTAASLTILVWSGGAFALLIFLISVFLMTLVDLECDEPNRTSLANMSTAAIFCILLVAAYYSLGLIASPLYLSSHLFILPPLFFMLAIVSYVASLSSRKTRRIFALILLLIFMAVAIVGAAIYFPQFAYKPIDAAIIEIEPPNLVYFIASYGPSLFITPAFALVFFSSPVIMFLLALVLVIAFWKLGRVGRSSLGIGYVPLSVFLLITLVLNSQYIRFNMLASIPIAIMAAYGIVLVLKKFSLPEAVQLMVLLLVLFTYVIIAIVYVATWHPANFISPSYIQALDWIRNDTPSNSVVLTEWMDGSEVSGWANRITLSDSVADFTPLANKWFLASAWFASSNATMPVFSTQPNYVLVREAYINESIGMCQFLNDSAAFNCTLSLTPNNTANLTYFQKVKPNFYELLTKCSQIGCTMNEGEYNATLVFNNSDSKIYQVNP